MLVLVGRWIVLLWKIHSVSSSSSLLPCKREEGGKLSHFPPSVGAWFSCCFFFLLCSKSPLHARIHIWLVIISPWSLSLLSLFPHAPTKRLRPMDSGGRTGRVFSARGIDLLPFPSAVLYSTLSSNMSEHIESGWLEKEEKTNVCSLQTCDGLVRCFSFRIYRWHVDG